MPYNDNGIYYADTSTALSMQDTFQTFAESIDDKLDILQTVTAKYSTIVSTTSGTEYAFSGLSATITPKLQSSKIIVVIKSPFAILSGAPAGPSGMISFNSNFAVYKNSGQISTAIYAIGDGSGSDVGYFYDSVKTTYTDIHNTLSPITYSLYGRIGYLTGELKMNYSKDAAAISSITLMEVR